MIIAGFTGTREGMSCDQMDELRKRLKKLKPGEFHHGDCKGADQQAHTIARDCDVPQIDGHPCNINSMRAYCEVDCEWTVKEPLVRNREIVDECDVLIVCPRTKKEELRSGTWSTVRYARGQAGKRIILIYPNGDIEEETGR